LDNRLKKEKDFEKVFKKGQKAFSDTVTVYYLPADECKVGYAVGKKHGKSVKRNRIKRLLRESFRSFKLKDTQNFFFVIIPKVKEEYRLDLFKRDLNYIFRKIKVL
jgi:ribonuclease P protein component